MYAFLEDYGLGVASGTDKNRLARLGSFNCLADGGILIRNKKVIRLFWFGRFRLLDFRICCRSRRMMSQRQLDQLILMSELRLLFW